MPFTQEDRDRLIRLEVKVEESQKATERPCQAHSQTHLSQPIGAKYYIIFSCQFNGQVYPAYGKDAYRTAWAVNKDDIVFQKLVYSVFYYGVRVW